MPTPTYIPLANLTLGSSASSVTFSSIPATYRDLVVVGNGAKSAVTQIRIEFNSDTGNLSVVDAYGYGSSSFGSFTSTQGRIADTSTAQSSFVTQIMDYSAIDKHKTYLSRSGDTTYEVHMFAGRWASTSAITTIKIFPTTGTFNSNYRFDLYGIAS